MNGLIFELHWKCVQTGPGMARAWPAGSLADCLSDFFWKNKTAASLDEIRIRRLIARTNNQNILCLSRALISQCEWIPFFSSTISINLLINARRSENILFFSSSRFPTFNDKKIDLMIYSNQKKKREREERSHGNSLLYHTWLLPLLLLSISSVPCQIAH